MTPNNTTMEGSKLMTTNDSETTETTEEQPVEAAEEAQETPQEPEEHQEAAEDDSDDSEGKSKASKEAAKYRRQLRDTETERDELQASVTTLRTAIAESALEGVLQKPSSLWMTGYNVADFYDKSGNLDTHALHDAAQQATKDHGLQSHKRFQGSADGGAREQGPKSGGSFADMFRPKG